MCQSFAGIILLSHSCLSCWQEIDDYIAKAKEQGYHTVLHLGTKGVNYATTVLMQTAIKVSH
jgi:hypothetical protein